MEEAGVFLVILQFFLFLLTNSVELHTISGSRFLRDDDTLVSPTRIFKLGFFQAGSSKNKYLGILYNKIPVSTVVWVANRNQPITDASPNVLKIDDPGILVLSNNIRRIWSSNTTTTSGNVTAKLRDTGNLVLMDQKDKVLWQSFDYPTDTLLPGMKLGYDYSRGIEWHLTSWKSNEDPALGELTWGSDMKNYPENKLKQGAMVKFRGGPWKNRSISAGSQFQRNLTTEHRVVITEREVSFSYNIDNNSFLPRVTLSSSGQLESWMWIEDRKKWQLAMSLPMDVCDTYSICGAYGICRVNRFGQSCGCLDDRRFVPRKEKSWETGDWSGGCVRRTPLACKNGSEGFIKYAQVKRKHVRQKNEGKNTCKATVCRTLEN